MASCPSVEVGVEAVWALLPVMGAGVCLSSPEVAGCSLVGCCVAVPEFTALPLDKAIDLLVDTQKMKIKLLGKEKAGSFKILLNPQTTY